MIRLFAISTLLAVAINAQAMDVATKAQKTCGVCHVAGVAGAPKIGDKAAWEPRMAKGMDVMIASVVNGKGAMPPKGLCNDCSNEDYKALIEYLVGQ